MIKKIATYISGVYILENPIFSDERGTFKKTVNSEDFSALGLDCNFKELYYSINKKNVIRGMHFQTPPADHVKMVYCISGSITDVVLDIRKSSLTYGKFFTIDLSVSDARYVYIPKGCAHGFAAHEDNTIVHYAQTSCYDSEHDSGILFSSFGFDWKIEQPIVSQRDSNFPPLYSAITYFD